MLRGIDERVTKAEQAVAGKAPVKRNRFIQLSGGTRKTIKIICPPPEQQDRHQNFGGGSRVSNLIMLSCRSSSSCPAQSPLLRYLEGSAMEYVIERGNPAGANVAR
jgi:hypothetical protein